ncbi:hypothetical protein HGRIS_010214 [Hohenbuehelia grisea]|uniref:Eukaryotic translation initiation factor 3 subunit M n=1 Tax=Hohenbuehelia grisea TaxID=104357 RepID=A0ABR3J3L7_9AGAR
MFPTDSVAVFAEGTFEEQTQELVNYVVRSRSDEERAAFIRPFQDALKTADGAKPLDEDAERKRKILNMLLVQVKTLGDGNEKEIEGFFNLIYAHLFNLYDIASPELAQLISGLVETISSAPSASPVIKQRILHNLFNAIPHRSSLRLAVYKSRLALAVQQGDLQAVLPSDRATVEKWLSEWDISTEQKSALLKSISDAYAAADESTASYEYQLSYVRSLPSTTPEAKTAAVEAIATALRLPTVFDFDQLFKLDAVVAAKGHELFSLLHIFLNDGLSEYKSWESSHAAVLEQHKLDKVQLERKIRLLSLASLGFQHIGHDLPYSTIAETLQVESSQVEKWVIDVVRVGLISGKLSQTTHTLHITRASARTFQLEEWKALEKRAVAWKAGLATVLEVIANARRSAGN